MTPKQQRCLAFIRGHLAANGFAPTFQEMADHLGTESKGNVARIVAALEAQGRIRRAPGHVRNLVIVETDEPLRISPKTRLDLLRYCLSRGKSADAVIREFLDVVAVGVSGRAALTTSERERVL